MIQQNYFLVDHSICLSIEEFLTHGSTDESTLSQRILIFNVQDSFRHQVSVELLLLRTISSLNG